jgi:putative ribosome biogenesis GTPase RsgA
MSELMGEAEAKGEKRAFDEIASVLCECHFTDGFCNGRDRPDCKCNTLAAAAMAAIKSRGVRLTWSPASHPPTKDKAGQ